MISTICKKKTDAIFKFINERYGHVTHISLSDEFFSCDFKLESYESLTIGQLSDILRVIDVTLDWGVFPTIQELYICDTVELSLAKKED